MSNHYAYTEMIAKVEAGLTPVSTVRLIGSGNIIAISANLLGVESFDTIAHFQLSFRSTDNISAAPGGPIFNGNISLLSGVFWNGKVFMAPNMDVTLTVNCILPASLAVSILVEHEDKK